MDEVKLDLPAIRALCESLDSWGLGSSKVLDLPAITLTLRQLCDAVERAEAALTDAQVSSSLDRENLNAQLADWRERALRCEKLRREIVPVKP